MYASGFTDFNRMLQLGKDYRAVPYMPYIPLQMIKKEKFFLDAHLPFQVCIYPFAMNARSLLAKLAHLYSTMQGY